MQSERCASTQIFANTALLAGHVSNENLMSIQYEVLGCCEACAVLKRFDRVTQRF
jgi:hypothetical protein